MVFSYPSVMKTKQYFLLVSVIHGHKAVMTVFLHESIFFSQLTSLCQSLNFDWLKPIHDHLINQTSTEPNPGNKLSSVYAYINHDLIKYEKGPYNSVP